MTIDLWTASSQFHELGQELQATKALTGRVVLDRLLSWYRNSRIEGALLANDGDMLLLSWGGMDFYSEDAKAIPQRLRYLSFTRQVWPTSDDPDAEFDDDAVTMTISLGIEPADGAETSSDLWISTPDDINQGAEDFLNPYVQSLIDKEVQRFFIADSNCG